MSRSICIFKINVCLWGSSAFYSKLSSFVKKVFYFAVINDPIIFLLFYSLCSKVELENWILII